MMCTPETMSSSSMLARALELEKEAGQLKLQAAQMKQNSFLADVSSRLRSDDEIQMPKLALVAESEVETMSDISPCPSSWPETSSDLSQCPSSWQSPGATPRARSPAPSDFMQSPTDVLSLSSFDTQAMQGGA